MRELQRRKTTHQLAFSLALDSVEVSSLDFVAPDEQIFDYWTDGINALLGTLLVQFIPNNKQYTETMFLHFVLPACRTPNDK